MSGFLHKPLMVDMQWIKSNFYSDLEGVMDWSIHVNLNHISLVQFTFEAENDFTLT
jgi:hypothetical protein